MENWIIKNKKEKKAYVMMIELYDGNHEVGLRLYAHYASRKLGIEDRLIRFERIVANTRGKCIPGDVVMHYVDSVYMPILQNSNQLALAIEKRKIPRYIHNQFIKALLLNDKTTLRQLIRNYVENVTEDDDVVSQNQNLIPCVFGSCYGSICPAGNSSCPSNASEPCFNIILITGVYECCTSVILSGPSSGFGLVDNTPWVSNYSTGVAGLSWGWNSQNNTVLLQASITIPSCFPGSGINTGLDFVVRFGSAASGYTCASSCPSGSVCGLINTPYCPGSTYSGAPFPTLYYNINLLATPNTTYTVWWQIST